WVCQARAKCESSSRRRPRARGSAAAAARSSRAETGQGRGRPRGQRDRDDEEQWGESGDTAITGCHRGSSLSAAVGTYRGHGVRGRGDGGTDGTLPGHSWRRSAALAAAEAGPYTFHTTRF